MHRVFSCSHNFASFRAINFHAYQKTSLSFEALILFQFKKRVENLV